MHFNYRGGIAARRKLDIGHHINNLFFKRRILLEAIGGELIEDRQSGFEVND